MTRRTLLCAIRCAAIIALIPGAAIGRDGLRPTGTFSNLKYNAEGGDLLGVEIKIVPVRRGLQGALQIAEGGSSEIIVVNVTVQGVRVKFDIRKSYPVYGGGSFQGVLDAGGISGRFTFNGNVQDEIRLRRGRGYWDN